MKFKILTQILAVTGISLLSAIAFSDKPALADTTFECIKAGKGFATIAVTEEGEKTEPLITWNSRAFTGSNYTPESRCNEVNERLNNVVANAGGSFSDVLLTTGTVNGYGVICWVNDEQSGCNSSNVLVTMSPGKDPGQFLANLVNRRANPFEAGVPGQESKKRTVVKFGAFVEQAIKNAKKRLNRPTNNRPTNNRPSSPSNNGGRKI